MSTKFRGACLLLMLTIWFVTGLSHVAAQERTLTATYTCQYSVIRSGNPAVWSSGTFSFAPWEDNPTVLYGGTAILRPFTVNMEIQRERRRGPDRFFRLCYAHFDLNSDYPYVGSQTGSNDCSDGARYTIGQPITWDSWDRPAGGLFRWARCSVTISED
jgi:hypothetical protein